MMYQVGKTPLRKIPIHRDPKLVYTQRPLFTNSINFEMQLDRDELEIPAGDAAEKLMT